VFQEFSKFSKSGINNFLSKESKVFNVEFQCRQCKSWQVQQVEIKGFQIVGSQLVLCSNCNKYFSISNLMGLIKRFFRPITINNIETISSHNIFIDSVAACSALVITADEAIKREEVKEFFDFIRNIYKTTDSIEYAKSRLNFYLTNRQVISSVIKNLNKIEINARLAVIELLFCIAFADNDFDRREEQSIKDVAISINVDNDSYAKIRSQFSGLKDNDFQILGINEITDFSEIKSAYRRKCLEFHPDKYQNLPESFQEFAKQQFQIVQAAYERLRKRFENV